MLVIDAQLVSRDENDSPRKAVRRKEENTKGFVGSGVKAWRVMLDREPFLSRDDINNT